MTLKFYLFLKPRQFCWQQQWLSTPCDSHTAFPAGHPDITRFEWAVNIHRDSHASYIGRHYMLSYFAAAENEAIGRVRFNMLNKMLLPCGLPPKQAEDDAGDMSE